MNKDYSERLWQLRNYIKKNYNNAIDAANAGLPTNAIEFYSANDPLMQEVHGIFGDDKKGLVGFITSNKSKIGNQDWSIRSVHYKATASISDALYATDPRIKTVIPNLGKLVTKPVRDFYNQEGNNPPSQSNLSPTSAVFIPASQRLKSDNAQEFVPQNPFSPVVGYTPLFDGKPTNLGSPSEKSGAEPTPHIPLSQIKGNLYDPNIHGKSNLSPSQKIIQLNSPLSQLGGKTFILEKDGRALLPRGRKIVGAERTNKNPNGQTPVR